MQAMYEKNVSDASNVGMYVPTKSLHDNLQKKIARITGYLFALTLMKIKSTTNLYFVCLVG